MGIYEFKLPDVGEGMHEGEIAKWHIKPGDTVEEDQILLDVQNDKATVELPSPIKGKVQEILAPEGKVAQVGEVLATFEVEGAGNVGDSQAMASTEEPTSKHAPEDSKSASATPARNAALNSIPDANMQVSSKAASPSSESEPTNQMESNKTVLATPSVRRLAREKGINLASVPATGRNGQVTREDLENYIATGGQTAAESQEIGANEAVETNTPSTASYVTADEIEERVLLRGIRKVIAAAMVKSVYTAPHVTIMDEVEVSKLVALRQRAKVKAEKKNIKLTYLPFMIKALVAAAKQYPILNASLDEESNEIVYKRFYHVGIATDTDAGLMVPVIEHADSKNMWKLAEHIKDLAERAQEGKLAPNELKGSTISITNIGSVGGMYFTPVINYPEVAILGVGRIAPKPVVKDGEVTVGQVMALSLSFDHRIIDGATAQLAMNYIKQLLEQPELIILEV